MEEKKSSCCDFWKEIVKSGQGVAKLLSKLSGNLTSTIFRKWSLVKAAKMSPMVITSPGFPVIHPWIRLAHKSNLTVVGG